MPHPASEIDASFYRLIHQLVGSQPEGDPAERRRAERRPFHAVHRIAPRRGPGFPDEGEFIEVQCHDLTRAGFSFFLPNPPDFSSLIVAFHSPCEVIYVAAEVSYSSSVLLHPSGLVEHVHGHAGGGVCPSPDSQSPTPTILVGCRFIEQLEKAHRSGTEGQSRFP